jgi:peptidoglycan/LPS O-acetylase OafA/YrhL
LGLPPDSMRGSFLTGVGQYSYTLYIGHFPLLLAMWFVAFHTAPVLLTAQWAPFTALAAMAVTWLAMAALGRWVERPDLFRRRAALAPLTAQ